MLFFSISYMKTISDHSGLKFPLNPTNIPHWNNAQYHDVHHSPTGLKLNYSQPYFTFWDKIYGCFKDPLDGVEMPAKKEL
jgi:sphinganine C4-monooxygenase